MSSVLSTATSAVLIHEQLFGISVNQTTTLQFSLWGAGVDDVNVSVYFDNQSDASPQNLSHDISTQNVRLLVSQEFPPFYSGQLLAGPGLYIFQFDLNTPAIVQNCEFMVRYLGAYGSGITIQIGSRTDYNVNGTFGIYNRALEGWNVTIYSNEITNVTLSVANLSPEGWAKFSPSSLQNVGPAGKETTLLLAGEFVPFIPNDYNNISVFIGAQGSDNSLQGAAAIDVLPDIGTLMIHSPQSIGSVPESNYANTMLTTGETQVINYGVFYDPNENTSEAPLSVGMSISGIINNGRISPLPSWLVVNSPQPSFQLYPNEEYVYGFNITVASSAPDGIYNLAVSEAVSNHSFNGVIMVIVTAPGSSG